MAGTPATPTVTPLWNQGLYLITVRRGQRGQRKRRVAVTDTEARMILAQLVGHLRAADRADRNGTS